MTYVQHPLSAAFPAMKADELQDLRDSIGNIGVQNPITLFEGMVIDGWHRYSVATEFGMACPEVELDPLIDARDFVLAQNKARRHVTLAQLIAAASKVYEWRPKGGDQSALSADCISSKALAAKVGAGTRSVEQFRQVERDAIPEVLEAVARGEVGLPKASAIAKLPQAEQPAALANPLQRKTPAITAPPPAVKEQPDRTTTGTKAPSAPRDAVQLPAVTEAADDERDLRIAALEEEAALLREQLADAASDLAVVVEAVDPDERLAAALREVQEQRTLCRNLQLRIDSLVNEVGEAKRQAAYWKRKAEQPA